MKLEKLFWRFYDIIQREIDETPVDEVYRDVQSMEIEGIRSADEDFFYSLVVFGDELIINRGDEPFLEANYFRSAEGRKNLLRDMRELLEKNPWSTREHEIAWIYYHMLIIGFQKKAEAIKKNRLEIMDSFQNRLLKESPDKISMKGKGLSPSIYHSIYEGPTKMKLFPSLRNTVIWSIILFLSIYGLLNYFWYSYTLKIRENLLEIQKKISRPESD